MKMSLDDWKWIGIFAMSWLGMMLWIIWKTVRDEQYHENDNDDTQHDS